MQNIARFTREKEFVEEIVKNYFVKSFETLAARNVDVTYVVRRVVPVPGGA